MATAERKLIHPVERVARDSRWWLPEYESKRGERVTDVVVNLYRLTEPWRHGCWRWSGLYANDPFLSMQLGYTSRSRNSGQRGSLPAPLALNGVKAVSDTYVAMITEDRPKVSVVTSGAPWDLQQKAANLEKFIEGVFYENDIYRTSTLVNYDVVKMGTGVVKVADARPRKNHIRIERVLPWELLVDPEDAFYGDPQCMYQIKRVDRLVLQELWPEQAEEIASRAEDIAVLAVGSGGTGTNAMQSPSDYVILVEAWRRRQAPDAPGRHTICSGPVVLVDEEWDRDTFPFEFLYRQQPSDGVWGMSLGQELSGLQLAVNKLLRDIQRAQNLIVGHYLIENSADVNTGSISDRIGGFIRYRGTKPEYVAPPPVADQNIVYLQQLWQRMFETIGISQQQAQSQKPAGLNSGKALMVYADIQSQRFKPSYQEYQNFFIRLAKQVICCAREMDTSFYVQAAGKTVMSSVSWADTGGLEDSEFALKLYPTNALADDPASRIQQVQDLMVAKLITDKQGRRLLDNPDLEALNNLENASYNLVQQIKTNILNKGEKGYVGPEPFMDLAEGIQIMQQAYLLAKLGDAEEARLELLSRWISSAHSMLVPPEPPPGAPGASPGPAMPGMPGPGGPPALPGMPQRTVGGPMAPGVPPPLPVTNV